MNAEAPKFVPEEARVNKRPERKPKTPERRSELLNLQEELGELTGELKRLEKAGLGDSEEAVGLRYQIDLTTEAMEGQSQVIQKGEGIIIDEPVGESLKSLARKKAFSKLPEEKQKRWLEKKFTPGVDPVTQFQYDREQREKQKEKDLLVRDQPGFVPEHRAYARSIGTLAREAAAEIEDETVPSANDIRESEENVNPGIPNAAEYKAIPRKTRGIRLAELKAIVESAQKKEFEDTERAEKERAAKKSTAA